MNRAKSVIFFKNIYSYCLLKYIESAQIEFERIISIIEIYIFNQLRIKFNRLNNYRNKKIQKLKCTEVEIRNTNKKILPSPTNVVFLKKIRRLPRVL